MNAYELADCLEVVRTDYGSDVKNLIDAANTLRQQSDRIAELEKHLKTQKIGNALVKAVANFPVATPQIKELSDEEIEDLADKYLSVNYKYGEDIYVLGEVEFAKAILKKANFTCNGFCGEQECKENQDSCKRIKKASEK